MDKFYLAKITDLMQEGAHSKLELVDVQFSRKPPTFGLMYLTTKVYMIKSESSNGDENNNANSINNKKLFNKTSEVVVNLSVMQINKDNFANFKPLKHVDLSNSKDATNKTIVDFDTSKTIVLNEEADDQHLSSQSTTKQQSLDCLILTDDGSLYGVDMRLLPYLASAKQQPTLAAGVIKLTSNYETNSNKGRFSRGSFIQCKFQQSTGDSSIFIHVLAEKHYWLYELTPFSNNRLNLISEYSINNSNIDDRSISLRFTRINTIKTNPQVVLLELNNSSLRIVQQSKCIFNQNLNDHFNLESNIVSNLILSSNKSSNESILLSFAGTKIIAQNLQITTELQSTSSTRFNHSSPAKQLDKDPDKLIPKDPSFELDKCWSIDLHNDIENLTSIERDEEENSSSNYHFRIENDKIKYGSLMPMWSTNSLFYSNSEESQSWPEYLVVTYKYYILIYSFEQQTVLPFSVVYDSSFLKLTPLGDKITSTTTTNTLSEKHLLSTNNEPKFVDVKTRPKLLHNFKLIGSHPTDVLFNNILLNNNNNLIGINFFPLLNLMVSLTYNGDMFAFKLNSSLARLDLHKDNLFQKQYAEAICGDSLLKDQMRRLQREIGILKSNTERLEEESLKLVGKNGQESNHLSALIQTELRQSDDTECLYYISMCLSNLIKVSQVIIMSSVNSYIMKPVSTINCQSFHIENDIDILQEENDLNRDQTLNLDSSKKLIDNNVLQHKDDKLIKTWAIIDLEKEDPALSRVIKLNLPIFITDKQQGFIKVFYILDDCPQRRSIESIYDPIIRSQLSGNIEHSLFETFNKFNTMFHIEELRVKPLISYQQVSKDEPLFANSIESDMTTLKITGSCKRDSMISWLTECFQDSINFRKSKVKLKSQFNHSSIEYNVLDDDSSTQILLSSDDVISLDLIKKHILKRATDESTKLNISQNPPISSTLAVPSNQSQTNESQLKLMNLVRATLPDLQKQSSEQLESSVDMIIDNLMSETSSVDQGQQIDLNSMCFKLDQIKLENSLREDLEKLIKEK